MSSVCNNGIFSLFYFIIVFFILGEDFSKQSVALKNVNKINFMFIILFTAMKFKKGGKLTFKSIDKCCLFLGKC